MLQLGMVKQRVLNVSPLWVSKVYPLRVDLNSVHSFVVVTVPLSKKTQTPSGLRKRIVQWQMAKMFNWPLEVVTM